MTPYELIKGTTVANDNQKMEQHYKTLYSYCNWFTSTIDNANLNYNDYMVWPKDVNTVKDYDYSITVTSTKSGGTQTFGPYTYKVVCDGTKKPSFTGTADPYLKIPMTSYAAKGTKDVIIASSDFTTSDSDCPIESFEISQSPCATPNLGDACRTVNIPTWKLSSQ